MITERQKSFRQEYRARILGWYDGYVHIVIIYAIGAAAYQVARDVVVTECRAEGQITLGRFRDLVGTGRRDAQLLLERLDQDGVTRRLGDARVLRRAARES